MHFASSASINSPLCSNAFGAVLFKEAAPNFINPSRVSPLRLSSNVTSGSSSSHRLMVDNRIAVCVSALFCSESVIVAPKKIGANSERMRKWLSGVFHNQEWERWEAIMCLVFGEQVMYAQLTPQNALAFQSMISPLNANSATGSSLPKYLLPLSRPSLPRE